MTNTFICFDFNFFVILFPTIFTLLVSLGMYFSYIYTGEYNLVENISTSIFGSLFASVIGARLYPNAKNAKATTAQKKGFSLVLVCMLTAVAGFVMMHSGYVLLGKLLAIPSVIVGSLTIFIMYVSGQGSVTIE